MNLRAETGSGLWLTGIHNVRDSSGFSWVAGLAWNHGLSNASMKNRIVEKQ